MSDNESSSLESPLGRKAQMFQFMIRNRYALAAGRKLPHDFRA
jgi:hypothetical protein